MDALVVDFRQQIFNDALYCLEQAKQLDQNTKTFEYWKYCTWSIVAACMCMESYIKSHIKVMTENDPDILMIYQSYGKGGIYNNIKFIEDSSGNKIIDISDPVWRNIENTITLRNDIVHFNRYDIFNSLTVTNVENAIKACRDFIKKFHVVMDMPYSNFAPWIDKLQSQNYDKS